MNLALSPTVRRALALAILLGLIALVWVVALQPLVGLVLSRRADIALASQRVADLEKVVERRPELERRLHEGKRQLATAGGFWNGASTAAIAAGVEDRLRTAVAASGGRVTSTSAAGEAAEFGFRKITVHCRIEGTLDTLTKTLTAIERARPALFTDSLTVEARDDVTDGKGARLLYLDLDVSGYSAAAGS